MKVQVTEGLARSTSPAAPHESSAREEAASVAASVPGAMFRRMDDSGGDAKLPGNIQRVC